MAWSKESRIARGYGKEWQRIRKLVLARDCGLCQVCRKAGRIGIATQVDHIISKAKARRAGWTDEQMDHMENLQAICKTCHDIKTLVEEGKQVRVAIGPDGWPVA